MMDLDVVWQVHLWSRMTLCVRWGSGRGNLGSQPSPEHAIASCSQIVFFILQI